MVQLTKHQLTKHQRQPETRGWGVDSSAVRLVPCHALPQGTLPPKRLHENRWTTSIYWEPRRARKAAGMKQEREAPHVVNLGPDASYGRDALHFLRLLA